MGRLVEMNLKAVLGRCLVYARESSLSIRPKKI